MRCPYTAPEPSRALAAFLSGVHALSFAAAWLNPLPLSLRLALALGVLGSGGLAWRGWRKPALAAFKQQSDGGWLLHAAAGAPLEASLLGSSLACAWFVLLHFRAGRRRFNVLVCRDSLPPEAFRRLRVALKVAALADAQDPLNP